MPKAVSQLRRNAPMPLRPRHGHDLACQPGLDTDIDYRDTPAPIAHELAALAPLSLVTLSRSLLYLTPRLQHYPPSIQLIIRILIPGLSSHCPTAGNALRPIIHFIALRSRLI